MNLHFISHFERTSPVILHHIVLRMHEFGPSSSGQIAIRIDSLHGVGDVLVSGSLGLGRQEAIRKPDAVLPMHVDGLQRLIFTRRKLRLKRRIDIANSLEDLVESG